MRAGRALPASPRGQGQLPVGVLHAASAFAGVAVVPVWGVCSGESSVALKTPPEGPPSPLLSKP